MPNNKKRGDNVASPRSSPRSRGQLEQDKMTAQMQELAGRLSEILGDEFVKLEVEPILKLNKKKLN
jgi:hypothetical protein|tara:strand:+ start:1749 stop:1946 length:198 start_codon:yes stop_codon:yes gene_type:complete